ncbi:sensor histidine kinase [Streptomyces himalayensis]|uniref:histidine kinase n=1 Tax=Streptomyces himalayensis subsp. himalayensis TaxID=2756131 RepID=A0A7W0DGR7_9ACTN|nr:ATP-binding protein [Streptomyces himalayensis]MBA2944535.1 two-component sensor histidine kinase [Streptomyces himalayensis subsp. himalayensis]
MLDAYQRILAERKNPLGVNPTAWVTCREQARHIIAECAHTLRHGTEAPLNPQLTRKTRRLGGARLSQGIPPVYSVRAGSLFFQIAMDHLGRVFADRPGSEQYLMKVLPTLQTAITRRLEEGSSGYDLFLLDVVRDAAQQGRHGMAREIHDRIGSAASLALRQLELFELTQNVSSSTDARLGSLKQAILETLYTTRDIVTELRTRADTTGSLQVALSAFVTAMAIDEPEVEIHVEDPDDLLPRTVSDDLFIILRECLRNALAHASASRVTLDVRVGPGCVRASVRDDGVGFSPGHRRGNGIASLTERTQLLGGSLTIDSAPGRGTAVELTVPIDEEEHADDGRGPAGDG